MAEIQNLFPVMTCGSYPRFGRKRRSHQPFEALQPHQSSLPSLALNEIGDSNMDPYNHPTNMLYRLNTQQLVGLDKHQEMINSALQWQPHTPQKESTLNRRLNAMFATIVSMLRGKSRQHERSGPYAQWGRKLPSSPSHHPAGSVGQVGSPGRGRLT
jgi:hypothetical protein